MACSAACARSQPRPRSPAPAPKPRARHSAPEAQGQVVEEVTEETVYETFEGSSDVSEQKNQVLKEDLKRVHLARRKLITDIYANMPVII